MAIRAALAIVAAVLLVACRPAAPAAGPAPAASAPAASGAAQGDAPLSPPFTVKVGHPGTFGGSPIFLAKQRGYFTAEGLAVEHQAFKVSADMVPAVATGDLHVASGAINPALFNAVTRGVNFTLVADAGSFQPGRANTSLVIRKEVVDSGRYSRLEDLRGMTIGVPGPYTVNHFMLSVIADRHGFPLDDINITPVPMADSLLALRNGSLDGYYDVEPSPTIAEREAIGVRVLTSDQLFEGFQSSVVIYGPAMTSQPEAAKRFMVGYVRGVRDYLDAFFGGKERERATEDITREGIAVPRDIVPGGIHPDGRMTPASIEAILDWWGRMGAVKDKPDLRAMFDEQYVDYAARRLGPAK
jgi:NitT/TauT family transport system substrate-binding protein